MYFNFFLAETKSLQMNKPANLLLMEKEMSEGDKNLKMKMFFSEESSLKKSNESLWAKDGFFNEQRSELNLSKANFPENTLVYVNQARISTVKAGEQAIYMTVSDKIKPWFYFLDGAYIVCCIRFIIWAANNHDGNLDEIVSEECINIHFLIWAANNNDGSLDEIVSQDYIKDLKKHCFD